MMGSIDYGLMMAGLLTLGIQLVLLLIALACGGFSLLSLRRPTPNVRRGRICAWIALGLGVLLEVWIVLFFTPWRFPNARPLLFFPLPALQSGLCGIVLWGSFGSTRYSSTARLMIAVAAIALTTWGAVSLERWDRRRELLHWAEAHAAASRKFFEAFQTEMRCYEHGMRNQPCERCAGRSPSDSQAKYFRQFAEYNAALARSFQWAADHRGERPPNVEPPETWLK
jgi:hypothetical protein